METQLELKQRAMLEAALAPLLVDIGRTLDPPIDLRVTLLRDDERLWCWETSDTRRGICGTNWDPDDAPADALASLTAQLANDIPETAFDDVLEPWPRCPRHSDHPL